MRLLRWIALLPAACGLLLACSLVTPLPAEPKKEVLAQLPAELPRAAIARGVLLIPVPESEPVYDTTRMAWSAKPYEIGYFTGYEWAERPALMIQSLLAAALQETHGFHQVIQPPDFTAWDFALESRLLTLTQDYTATPPVLHAGLRVQLVSRGEGRVVASRDLAADERIDGKDPHAGVVAANRAVARVVRDAAAFAVENAGR